MTNYTDSLYYELYIGLSQEHKTQIAAALRIDPHSARKVFGENLILSVMRFYPAFRHTDIDERYNVLKVMDNP